MYYVYVLHSMKDGRLYTGFTSDLKKRLNEHLTAKVKSTERRLPLKLIYYEAYLNKTDAESREKFLKSGSGKRCIKKQLTNYFRDT